MKLSLQSTSGRALVAALHEKCLLGEMVRGGLSCIRKLRYRELGRIISQKRRNADQFRQNKLLVRSASLILNVR